MLKSGGSCRSFAKNSNAVPMMSPVASETPLADRPPGVVASSACPNSWPTTSSAPMYRLAVLYPIATYEPLQKAFTCRSPTSTG